MGHGVDMEPVEPGVNPPPTDTQPPPPAAPAKPSLKERFKTLLLEYGPLALILHYVIFGLTITGFAVAIRSGVQVGELAARFGLQMESTGSTATTYALAYGATQLTKPLRFAALFALTPLVARIPVVSRLLVRLKRWMEAS